MASSKQGDSNSKSSKIQKVAKFLFEYETPRVVTVHHIPLGILRLVLQSCVFAFVLLYQLWYSKGYQSFDIVASSVTTKVKGLSVSELIDSNVSQNLSKSHIQMYERIWDEADYVIPPSESNAFFIMTNAVITPNQTRGTCPEDHFELSNITCNSKGIKSSSQENNGNHSNSNTNQNSCVKKRIFNYKSHGPETGNCVKSDRGHGDVYVCEIRAWCPIELDVLPMPNEPLLKNTEKFTVLLKNSISFPWFGADIYRRNNMPNGICKYHPNDPETYFCPIFQLGDIVRLAGGTYDHLAIKGGVVGIDIQWNCDLDWDFMKYCLPTYSFRLLDSTGWNFRFANYHEENRRTLIKAYGIKFLISVNGKAGKFDLKNTVILIVTGLGLLGLANILCDFVLLNCSNRFRREIMEKKYEAIKTEDVQLAKSLKTLLANSANGDPTALNSLKAFASITMPPNNRDSLEIKTPNEEYQNGLVGEDNQNEEIVLSLK